jgi:hypothetical protein
MTTTDINTTIEPTLVIVDAPIQTSNMAYEATRLELEEAIKQVDLTKAQWISAVQRAILQSELVSRSAEEASDSAANLGTSLSERAQIALQDAQRLARESKEAADTAAQLRSLLTVAQAGVA